MLVDDKVDVFDGIVVRVVDGTRFVDADQVGQIFTSHVCTTLSADEVAHLPVPDHDPARRDCLRQHRHRPLVRRPDQPDVRGREV